eukprot:gnl/MRDRNA2_/MRDRNA2_141701_c0_seq1.p1 gnl/MRDRNA2_/MRDRNA2_141701_c0~~gnl/MRDRNA2_/MRDRNA2_141701_c0_seq1.p1  ORF type:complete len:345 (-),score=73.67 gnl/MRDRNA2_/MRDRNA2_141701_c0_seq1:30-995(-)
MDAVHCLVVALMLLEDVGIHAHETLRQHAKSLQAAALETITGPSLEERPERKRPFSQQQSISNSISRLLLESQRKHALHSHGFLSQGSPKLSLEHAIEMQDKMIHELRQENVQRKIDMAREKGEMQKVVSQVLKPTLAEYNVNEKDIHVVFSPYSHVKEVQNRWYEIHALIRGEMFFKPDLFARRSDRSMYAGLPSSQDLTMNTAKALPVDPRLPTIKDALDMQDALISTLRQPSVQDQLAEFRKGSRTNEAVWAKVMDAFQHNAETLKVIQSHRFNDFQELSQAYKPYETVPEVRNRWKEIVNLLFMGWPGSVTFTQLGK